MPDSSADRALRGHATPSLNNDIVDVSNIEAGTLELDDHEFGALIDEARMRTVRDEYSDIVDQLVDLFLTSTPPLLDELRDAAESGDVAELRRAAHKLKGSCQSIGATFMATLCRSIETGEGDLRGTVAELCAALEPTENAIRRALAA